MILFYRDTQELWSAYTWHIVMVQQSLGEDFRLGEGKTTLHFGWSLVPMLQPHVSRSMVGASISHKMGTALCFVIGQSSQTDDFFFF